MGILGSMKSRLGLGGAREYDDRDYDERGYSSADDDENDDAASMDTSTVRYQSPVPSDGSGSVRLVPREGGRKRSSYASGYGSSSSDDFEDISFRMPTTYSTSSVSASHGEARSHGVSAPTGRYQSADTSVSSSSPSSASLSSASDSSAIQSSAGLSSIGTVQTRPGARRSITSISSTSTNAGRQASVYIVKPSSYNEVETVSTVLKSGRTVVLSLGNTRPELAKRVLDFSFGVASALEGRVEKLADKVFLLTLNPKGLTDDERRQLVTAGVIK